MRKFRLICPDCNAAIITSSPGSLVWELCPSCRKHVWDGCDALMADAMPLTPPVEQTSRTHASRIHLQ